jgi:ABC-type transport system involved in multi-copper enzyme maturation permease subunit
LISIPRTLHLALLETFKMRRQRLALLVLGAPALTSALVPQGLWLSSRKGLQGFLALNTSLELSLLLGSFLLLLHSSVSLAWERSEKTLRNTLAGPARRSEVLLSRWLAIEVEVFLLALLVAGAALFSTFLNYRFEDIRGDASEPLFYADELRHHTILGVLYFVPPAMALVTLGLFLSVLSATPATAAALSMGALLLLDIGKSIFSGTSKATSYLFNSYLPTLFDQTSYLHGVTKLAEGVSDVLWMDQSPQHRLNFVVPCVYTVVLFSLSLVIFSRKDFTE